VQPIKLLLISKLKTCERLLHDNLTKIIQSTTLNNLLIFAFSFHFSIYLQARRHSNTSSKDGPWIYMYFYIGIDFTSYKHDCKLEQIKSANPNNIRLHKHHWKNLTSDNFISGQDQSIKLDYGEQRSWLLQQDLINVGS
jgi:hypothetical protein